MTDIIKHLDTLVKTNKYDKEGYQVYYIRQCMIRIRPDKYPPLQPGWSVN